MSAPLVRGAERVRHVVGGVVFLAVLAGLIAVAIASYQKAFTDVSMVELRSGAPATR